MSTVSNTGLQTGLALTEIGRRPGLRWSAGRGRNVLRSRSYTARRCRAQNSSHLPRRADQCSSPAAPGLGGGLGAVPAGPARPGCPAGSRRPSAPLPAAGGWPQGPPLEGGGVTSDTVQGVLGRVLHSRNGESCLRPFVAPPMPSPKLYHKGMSTGILAFEGQCMGSCAGAGYAHPVHTPLPHM